MDIYATSCRCCKDDWWNEVVDELRRGELLEENWRYLHGKPVEGCRLTAAERESRRRVIAGPGDPRLGEEKFRWAAAIVANNDAKYQINKDRAEDYSRAAESPLRWSVALDAPSAEVLREREKKVRARGELPCARRSATRPRGSGGSSITTGTPRTSPACCR